MKDIDVIEYTKRLIEKPSVTPDDQGCQLILSESLRSLGFKCEHLDFGDVKNLWAVLDNGGPLFVFAGHTDVVPTGKVSDWDSEPFSPVEKEGQLFGRGAADMKGSLAAMVSACQRLIQLEKPLKASIGFLITSDEEGPAINGTIKVMETLAERKVPIKWCLVGEPSSSERLGDCVRVGRRGSLGFSLDIIGVQGHVAYPEKADNPVAKISPFLDEMFEEVWDQGNDYFPATSFQISNLNAGEGATNVIPGKVSVLGNFRFSTESSVESLKKRTQEILLKCGFEFRIDWTVSGLPFLTDKGDLVKATESAIRSVCGYEPELSTGGGTSDGRFIAPYNVEVVELGPINKTIHQVNEAVACDDLYRLTDCYYEVLKRLIID